MNPAKQTPIRVGAPQEASSLQQPTPLFTPHDHTSGNPDCAACIADVDTRGFRATVLASEVRPGDRLVVPEGYVTVSSVDTFDLHPMRRRGQPHSAGFEHCNAAPEEWPCLRIMTNVRGYARFPNEPVEVLRRFPQEQ
jgi:hypothetical protein